MIGSKVVFVLMTSGGRGDNYLNLQCGGNKHPCLGWAVKCSMGED